MIRRIFVHADIVLDFLLRREPFFNPAAMLFIAMQNGWVRGCVSPLIHSNLFYMLRKGSSPQEAVRALQQLKLLTRTLSVDQKTLEMALASLFSDFEDALHYYTAANHDVDAIVTRNIRDYKTAKLPVLTAEEFVSMLQERAGEVVS